MKIKIYFLAVVMGVFPSLLMPMTPNNHNFDPVKMVLMGTYSSVKPLITEHSTKVFWTSVALTALGGITKLASDWYTTNKETERLRKELIDYVIKNCYESEPNEHASAYLFYHQMPKYAHDTTLGTLMAEFDLLFQQNNKTELRKKYSQISLYIAEQQNFLF